MNTINNGLLTNMLFNWTIQKKFLLGKSKKKAVQLRTAFYENRVMVLRILFKFCFNRQCSVRNASQALFRNQFTCCSANSVSFIFNTD